MLRKLIVISFILLFSLSACGQTEPNALETDDLATEIVAVASPTKEETKTPTTESVSETQPSIPTQIPTKTLPPPTPTPDTRLDPHNWRAWPVVPTVSARAKEIYNAGLLQGASLSQFSVIGDCQSEPPVFLGIYDTEDRYYLTDDYAYLQSSVDHFKGSFARDSVAVASGMSVASVFSPLWASDEACKGGETPLECEFRLHNPSIAIISLGTNWKPAAEITFENYLREIVDFVIAEGTLPVLVTKADNIEEDNLLNEIIAQVAYDYDIPLWNFWRSVQHLPNKGIDPELKGGLIYLVPEAWDVKSFTGLQTLDAILATLEE